MGRIVIAPDSFKGSLTAVQAADIMAEAAAEVFGGEIQKLPMADGGEGTVEAVVAALGGTFCEVPVRGPLGRPVTARYGILPDGTAVMEMAAASGILLLAQRELNPLLASTYGTGEMLAAALNRGCRHIILGIGGSATNDGGAGMAEALGVRFVDAAGKPLSMCGGTLAQVAAIDCTGLHPALAETVVEAACDVTNPLCGPQGASYVFGPQKGADEETAADLDRALAHYAALVEHATGTAVLSLPGGGAAGGLGAGLVAFCGAKLRPGFDLIAEAVGLEAHIRDAALVLTGEGCTDAQTAFGKLPSGVGRLAKRHGRPCVVVSGAVRGDVSSLYDTGVTAVFSCVTVPQSLEEALAHAAQNLHRATRNVVRLYMGGSGCDLKR